MERMRLNPLTENEKLFAEQNHNLIYSFLHRYGYSVEDYYNIAVFGFLKAVEVYHRKESVQQYDFPFIAWQYMRAEIGNHRRKENAKRRTSEHGTVSLDADYSEAESLYNIVYGKSTETDVMEKELLKEVMKNLSDNQRKIVRSKLSGKSNKETFLLLEIAPSTYYKEMKRIRSIIDDVLTS